MGYYITPIPMCSNPLKHAHAHTHKQRKSESKKLVAKKKHCQKQDTNQKWHNPKKNSIRHTEGSQITKNNFLLMKNHKPLT